MSTQDRARRSPTSQGGLPLLPIVVAVVVVALLGVLVVSALGGDDEGGGDDAPPGIRETRDVTIEGDPLPGFGRQTIDEDSAVGTVAPTVLGADFDGTPASIAADGRPKAIAFLAHWCPHCRAEVPRLAEWLDANELPEGIDLVLVPTATSSAQPNYPPSEWLADAGLGDLPTVVDSESGDAHAAFGAGGFPFWVLLDADHRVVARFSGEFPDRPAVYTELFDALATGRPLADPRT